MQPTGWRGIFGGLKGSPAQQRAFNRIFNGVIGSDIVQDGKLTPQAQAYFKNYLPKSQPTWLQQKMPGFFPTEQRKPSQRMMQGIPGFAGSYMLGGLAEAGNELTYRDNPVMKPIAAGAGAASQGLNIGATMMMMGMSGTAAGIVGVGAAIAEVIKAFGEAKLEKILGVASALQRANSAWEDIYEDF